MQIGKEKFVKWPTKLKRNPKRGNPTKYCKYHRGTGHDTEDCHDLKNEIESLIHRGHLKQFVGGEAGALSSQQLQHQQGAGVIDVIAGGMASGGASALAQKAYARHLNIQEPTPKKQKYLDTPQRPRCSHALVFIDEDLKGVIVPHDDALVVTTIISNFMVKKILVNSGSSAGIIFYDTYERMKLTPRRLQPVDASLVGFSDTVTRPEGKITLPITVGTMPH
ncbi:PREDICTED: uncharacterized protein LOC104601503 [Nelumbo nucifera]|uniref:Uncharacterized protein LOC104601503 n=1 Tax=Nelumbo nucifera TaxID=4432 RepID=A0A1U8AKN2_NELNU|nr:PREDICTED: uncharacterized protein LOC104601503 [Nelumbo nucifera]